MLTYFINKLKENKFNISEDETKLSIDFKYFNGIEELFTYENLLELKENLNDSIKIYLLGPLGKNILLFLDSEEEFKEEIYNENIKKLEFKLHLDKMKFIDNYLLNSLDNPDEVSKIKNEFNINIFGNIENLNKKLEVDIRNYLELEKLIVKNKKNIILLIENDVHFKNKYLEIFSINNKFEYVEECNNELKSIEDNINILIDIRNTECNVINSNVSLIPDMFYFEFFEEAPKEIDKGIFKNLKNNLKNIMVKLSFTFICNYTGYINGEFYSVIYGNKNVDIKYEELKEISDDNYNNMYKIYSWVYLEDKSISTNTISNRINICRNVISMLISAKCQGAEILTIIDNSDKIYASIKENHKEFMMSNISKFFEEKNNLKKDILKDIENLTKKVSSLIDLISKNMTYLIGVTIAGVLGYISKEDLFMLKVLALIYLVQFNINMILSVPNTLFQYFQIKISFKNKCAEYVNLYFDDSKVKKFKKTMFFNKIWFWLYMIIVGVIIVYLNKYLIMFIKSPNEFIDVFKNIF